MKIVENDWISINNIVYKINDCDDCDEMRRVFLKSLQTVIGFDRASFYLSDKTGENVLSNPIGINFTDEQLKTYLDKYESLDYSRWVISCPQSKVSKETDLFPENVRESSQYYQQAYLPMDIHFSILIALSHNGFFLGSVALYRSKSKEDFSERDVNLLDILKDHLALRLFNDYRSQTYHTVNNCADSHFIVDLKEYNLTEREREVLELLYEGSSTINICEKLFIAPTTLKKHVSNIYRKVGISNRMELVHLLHQKSDSK